MSALPTDERLLDLLVSNAVEGLDGADLATLRSEVPGGADLLGPAAAAVVLAGRLPREPLPAALRERLIASGMETCRSMPRATVTTLASKPAAPSASRAAGWGWVAAAASLVVAIAGWWPQLAGREPAAPVVQAPPPAPPTAAELRAALVASGAPVIRLDWTATEDAAAAGATGDVVWDNAKQVGYMRFAGLASNDPTAEQYQLWIFDRTRDDRYPVDGGVFDIPAGATEVVVPIRAAVGVREPALFAVTVEKPGGVVVSARERIAVLAQVAQT